MFGLIQDWPLLCNRILDHAATYHAERPVITRSIEGPFHTTNYADLRKRALRVSQRLSKGGVTLARGGAIDPTLNPGLFPEQSVWNVNHDEGRIVMGDLTFVPSLEKIADKLKTIET